MASDLVNHHVCFEEVVSDYRKSGRYNDLFCLKALWVPSDFDADKEKQRELVGEILKSQIVNDILFNVVFGRLTTEDVRLFLSSSGVSGLNLAILHRIATQGFYNISRLKEQLSVSAGPIREKLPLLAGIGFVSKLTGISMYDDTQKGRLFLELASRIWNEHRNPPLTAEIVYVLKKLNCTPVSEEEVQSSEEIFPKNPYIGLIKTIKHLERRWGIDFSLIDYSEKEELLRSSREYMNNIISRSSTPRKNRDR